MSNRIEITDFTAPELDVYARIPDFLSQKAQR